MTQRRKDQLGEGLCPLDLLRSSSPPKAEPLESVGFQRPPGLWRVEGGAIALPLDRGRADLEDRLDGWALLDR